MADSLDLFTNMEALTLNGAISTTPAAGTAETWTVVSSAGLPTIPAGYQIRHTVNTSTGSDTAPEVVGITAKPSGTTVTVVRGLNGVVKTHGAADVLTGTVTAEWLNQVGHLNVSSKNATTTGSVTRAFGSAWDVGFQDTITGDTTYTFSAAAALDGFICRMELKIDNSAGHVVTLPAPGAGVLYSNRIAPTIGTGIYYLTLLTMDGGTSIVLGLAIPAAA